MGDQEEIARLRMAVMGLAATLSNLAKAIEQDVTDLRSPPNRTALARSAQSAAAHALQISADIMPDQP